MRTLHIDLETYSEVNLLKRGMYKYVEDPCFEILLFAYAFDDGPVRVIDMASGGDIPDEVVLALTDPKIIKMAHNAPFEITCLRSYGYALDTSQWQCTAVWAAQLGLPRSLGQISDILRLPKDKAKIKEGKALIKYFCSPCKPTKKNKGRLRNLPKHDPEKWLRFMEYNAQDVEAEREIERRLSPFPVPDEEWRIWQLDQEINSRGALVDLAFVFSACVVGDRMKDHLIDEAKLLTGLDNPNSLVQLKPWLADRVSEEIDTLRKEDVEELLKGNLDSEVRRVLEIRQELGKSSLSKYDALARAACKDRRIRGTLLFYGAARTGRWAGRIFQPQNLPKNYMKDLAGAKSLVEMQDWEVLRMLYRSPAEVLSQLIRTAIIAGDGKKLIVADFSAVEARCLAWLADEEWRLEVFRGDGKIYEASAAAAFKIPIELVTKGSPWRAQGKVLELACGYGGSVGAIDQMDKFNAIPEEDRKRLVQAWRAASPNIVNFWWAMGNAAFDAVANPGIRYKVGKGIHFIRERGMLFMRLPSGRRLAYPRPAIIEGKYGETVSYMGINQYTHHWSRIETYGPKLVENACQAICRDLLAYGMMQVAQAGYEIILHVHDEAIVEADIEVSVSTIEQLLAKKPDWAAQMPHKAEGYETHFYKKD